MVVLVEGMSRKSNSEDPKLTGRSDTNHRCVFPDVPVPIFDRSQCRSMFLICILNYLIPCNYVRCSNESNFFRSRKWVPCQTWRLCSNENYTRSGNNFVWRGERPYHTHRLQKYFWKDQQSDRDFIIRMEMNRQYIFIFTRGWAVIFWC